MFVSANYPKLHDWYSVKKSGCQLTKNDSLIEATALSIAEAVFAQSPESRFKIWLTSLDAFLHHSQQPGEDYQNLERFLSGMQFELTNFNSEMGYLAFESQQADAYGVVTGSLARQTNLVSFWFLRAWTALNSEDFETCIRICDSVHEDFAPIFTLKGQALLESGFAQESIPALEKALELDPGEILTWFQLAKAEWTLNHPLEAWDALDQCLRLRKLHPEVLIFQAQIALESETMNHKRADLLPRLTPFLEHLHNDPQYAECITRLALLLSSKEITTKVIKRISWSEIYEDLIRQKALSWILKRLGEYGWFDLANIILSQATGHHQSKISESPSDLNSR